MHDYEPRSHENKKQGLESKRRIYTNDRRRTRSKGMRQEHTVVPNEPQNPQSPFLNRYAEKFKIEKYYTKPMKEARNEWRKYTELWDMIECTETLQEVFLSTAIQHGQYEVVPLFINAYKTVSAKNTDESNQQSKAGHIIKLIYQYRENKSKIVTSRFETEMQLAIEMYAMETSHDTQP